MSNFGRLWHSGSQAGHTLESPGCFKKNTVAWVSLINHPYIMTQQTCGAIFILGCLKTSR